MINCRVGEAQNLLIASDYTATRIGTAVGYDSINHFGAVFHKKERKGAGSVFRARREKRWTLQK